MTEEKPLSVQVAEALGWTECEEDTTSGRILLPMPSGYYWYGWPPGALPIVGAKRPRAKIPLFEHEWQATGPLIEKYGISLVYAPCNKHEDCQKPPLLFWEAAVDELYEEAGETPLLAVCDLILRLKEAGKL